MGSWTFTVPGEYNYDCSVGSHAEMGMVGSITVIGESIEEFDVTFNIDGVEECGFVSVTGNFDAWSGWGATNDNSWTVDWNGGVAPGSYDFTILCVDTDIPNWWENIWGNSDSFFRLIVEGISSKLISPKLSRTV